MPAITFIEHNGTTHEVHVEAGTSVMQAAVDNDIPGIVAECGGACSCATCHCYVDEAWVGKIAGPSAIEKEMLDCVLEPHANSRLSCQIKVGDGEDGLVVRLPASQY